MLFIGLVWVGFEKCKLSLSIKKDNERRNSLQKGWSSW